MRVRELPKPRHKLRDRALDEGGGRQDVRSVASFPPTSTLAAASLSGLVSSCSSLVTSIRSSLYDRRCAGQGALALARRDAPPGRLDEQAVAVASNFEPNAASSHSAAE